MQKNTGLLFESLTQQIYQALLDHQNKGYRKIEVKHDIQILGKSGVEHQIDIYWDFELAGLQYKTIIEVKDWNSKVKKEQIMSFKAKLDDISGFPNGIFVSKSGFQSGALDYARANGIKVVCIEATNTMNHLIVDCHIRMPHIENFSLIWDKEWLAIQAKERDKHNKIKQTYRVSELVLLNDNDQNVPLIDFIHMSQQPYLDNTCGERAHIVYNLDANWYFQTGVPQLPKAFVSGFEFDFYITESEEIREFHPDWVADFLLRDLIDGTQIGFNSYHGIVEVRVQQNV